MFLGSFPYLGGSSETIKLGPESESIKLMDLKSKGIGVPGQRAGLGKEKKGDTKEIRVTVEQGEMFVHQERYMIFDNC